MLAGTKTSQFLAGENLKPYRLVTVSANNTVEHPSAVDQVLLGVVLNAPAQLEKAEIVIDGRANIEAAEEIAAGDWVGAILSGENIGKARAITSGAAVGLCTSGGGAVDFIEIVIARQAI